jgi:hypothetical protein
MSSITSPSPLGRIASPATDTLLLCNDTALPWVSDEDLEDEQRAAWRAFLTPRTGHERRLCWPLDDLDGGAP